MSPARRVPTPVGALPTKAFCPCDLGRPQDCKPEDWRPAHSERVCTACGCPSYQHTHAASDNPDDATIHSWCPARQFWPVLDAPTEGEAP